jgi:hypothetical protein
MRDNRLLQNYGHLLDEFCLPELAEKLEISHDELLKRLKNSRIELLKEILDKGIIK